MSQRKGKVRALPAPPWRLLEGDALEVMRSLESASVDSVVTDPPYGIDFKGAAWDGRDIRRSARRGGERPSDGEAFERFTAAWAAEALRVLKPGGYLVAFGATRMFHRLVAGVEDAGFEVRDQILWCYGSGVPKTKRLPGGRATALKPAYEPILLARKPLTGTLAMNMAAHGTGALNTEATAVAEPDAPGGTVWRWPANLVLSHDRACRPGRCGEECPRALIDRQHDGGPPSRLFYCPKPSRAEREAGCERLPETALAIFGTRSARPRRNVHPTIKPLALMGYLVRLVTPAGGLVLDPFAGSGTTGGGALYERRRFVGIEKQAAYATIARARLEYWERDAGAAQGDRRAA